MPEAFSVVLHVRSRLAESKGGLMSAFRVLGALGIGIVFAASAVTAWASGTMQKAPSGQMQQKAPAQTGKTIQTAPPIKMEAQSLTVTPAQPQAGQQVTVKFTVKNTGTGTVAKVPWSIHLATDNQTLGQGEKMNLGPGESFEVTAQWTPSAGQKLLQGYVDPTGQALKNTAPVSAQIKELSVTVAAAASASTPGTPVETETRVLEHLKAKNAGANFTANAVGATPCTIENRGGRNVTFTEEVELILGCQLLPGGRADFEVYSNFRLKNGWKVERVDVRKQSGGTADWSWVSSAPAVGSDNPYAKFHLWSNPNGYVYVLPKITIKGPKNTDPYQ